MVGWIEKNRWIKNGLLDGYTKWMVGCMDRKNRWMVRRKYNKYEHKIDGWQDGWIQIDGWLVGQNKKIMKKIAGWLDGQKKYKDGWMDIKNVWIKRKMDGWLDGWLKQIDRRLEGKQKYEKNRWMVGWMDRKNRWMVGLKEKNHMKKNEVQKYIRKIDGLLNGQNKKL